MTGGALDGIRVIELGQMVSAPYCGKLFADYGADVLFYNNLPQRMRGLGLDHLSLASYMTAGGKVVLDSPAGVISGCKQ